jgi:glutathione S-transferase
MIELYHSSFSTCSQKVRLCLAEKQLDYESREISFVKGEHLSAAYLKLNPNGVVPTLLHHGEAVTDSSVICEYLDEEFQEPALMPESNIQRAVVRAWMRYLEEVSTVAIRAPSYNTLFSGEYKQMGDEEFRKWADQLPIRKHFYLKMRQGKFSDEEVNSSVENLEQTLQRADNSLKSNKWLAGDQFTLADIVLTPTIIRMEDIGLAKMWDDLSSVSDWLSRIKSRPSFDVAFYFGSRITPDTFDWKSG